MMDIFEKRRYVAPLIELWCCEAEQGFMLSTSNDGGHTGGDSFYEEED